MKEEIIYKVFKDKGLMKQVFDRVKRIHRVLCYDVEYQTFYHSDIVYNYYSFQDGNTMYSSGHINLLKEKLKRNDKFLDGLPTIDYSMDEELVLLLFNRLNEQTSLSPQIAQDFCKYTLPTFIKLMEILETKYKIVPTEEILEVAIVCDNKDIFKYLIDKYPNFKISKDIIYRWVKSNVEQDVFNRLVSILVDHTVCGEYTRHYLMPLYCSNEKIELLCGVNYKPDIETYSNLLDYFSRQCILNINGLVGKYKNIPDKDIPEQEIKEYWMWFDSTLQRVIDTLVNQAHCSPLTQSITDIKPMFNDIIGLNTKSLMVILQTIFLLKYELEVEESNLNYSHVKKLIESHQVQVIPHLYRLVKCVELNNKLLDSVCELGTLDQVGELVRLMNLDNYDVSNKEDDKYIHLVSYEGMDIAANRGKLDIVEFLVENRTEQCSQDSIINNKHPKVIEYLLSVKPMMFNHYSLQQSLMIGDLDHFKWTINYYNNHPLLDQLDSNHRNNKPLVLSYQMITQHYNQLNSDQIIAFYQYLIQQYPTIINYYHLFHEACRRGDIKVLKYLDQCHPDMIESPTRFKTTILDDAFLNGWNMELVDFIINHRKERFGKESWVALGRSSLGIDEFELVSKHSPVKYMNDCIIHCLKSGNIQLLNHIKSIQGTLDNIKDLMTIDNIKNIYPTIQFYMDYCQPNIQDIMELVPSMIRDTRLCDYINMIKEYLQQSPYHLSLADLFYLLRRNKFITMELIFNNQSIFIIDQQIIKDITYLIDGTQLNNDFIKLLSTLSPHFNFKQTIHYKPNTIPLLINQTSNNNKSSLIQSTTSILSVFKNRYLLSKILGYTNMDDEGYYVLPKPKDIKYNLKYLCQTVINNSGGDNYKWFEYIIGKYSDQVHVTMVEEIRYLDDDHFELLLSKFPLSHFTESDNHNNHSKEKFEKYANYIPSNRHHYKSGLYRHSEVVNHPIAKDSFTTTKSPSKKRYDPILQISNGSEDLKKSIEGTLNSPDFFIMEYLDYIHYQYDYQLDGDETADDEDAIRYLYHNRADYQLTENSFVEMATKFGYFSYELGIPLTTSMYNQIGSQDLFLNLFENGVKMPPIDELEINNWDSVDLVRTFLLNIGFNCQDLFNSCPNQRQELIPIIIDWIQSGNDKSGITIQRFINDNRIDAHKSFKDDINIIIVENRMIGDNPISVLEDKSHSYPFSSSSYGSYSLSFIKWIVQHHPQLIGDDWFKIAANKGDLELLKSIKSYDSNDKIGFDVYFIDRLIKRLDIKFKEIVEYIIDENLLYESKTELEIYPHVYHIQKGILEDDQLFRSLLQSGDIKLIVDYLEMYYHSNTSMINMELENFIKNIKRVSSLVFKAIIPYCNHIPRDKLIYTYKLIKRPDLFNLLPPPPPPQDQDINMIDESIHNNNNNEMDRNILNLSFHTIICLQRYNLLEQYLPLSNLNVHFFNNGDKKKQILKSRYNIDILDDVQGQKRPFRHHQNRMWCCGGVRGRDPEPLKKKRIINWSSNSNDQQE